MSKSNLDTSLLSSVYSDVGMMKALDVPSLYTQLKSLRSMLKEPTASETVSDLGTQPLHPVAKELLDLVRYKEKQLRLLVLMLHSHCVMESNVLQ